MSAPLRPPPIFERARCLDAASRRQAAALVRNAAPDYFSPLSAAVADALIDSEFDAHRVELEMCVAVRGAEGCSAILCCYPMAELAERQYTSVQLVARGVDGPTFGAFASNLRTLRAGFPVVDGDGWFLAYISVATAAQGSGLADWLLQQAFLCASGATLNLLVRRDNIRAKAFYQRHGFALVAEGKTYELMSVSSASRQC